MAKLIFFIYSNRNTIKRLSGLIRIIFCYHCTEIYLIVITICFIGQNLQNIDYITIPIKVKRYIYLLQLFEHGTGTSCNKTILIYSDILCTYNMTIVCLLTIKLINTPICTNSIILYY